MECAQAMRKTWVKVMLIYLALIETDSDKEKIETIYTEYRGLMFYVANKILGDTMDSEDIVHDAFVKIAEIIEKIDTAKCPKTRNLVVTIVEMQSAVTNGHWCGGKRPQCGASAVGLS